jgi:hypothetical protein
VEPKQFPSAHVATPLSTMLFLRLGKEMGEYEVGWRRDVWLRLLPTRIVRLASNRSLLADLSSQEPSENLIVEARQRGKELDRVSGTRYATELSRLSDTYNWAREIPIEPLVAAISASSSLPLLAVGSGGSFSAAHLASYLHQQYCGMVSRPVTPLELLSSPIRLRSLGVMILSAGGSNADIVSALENAISREPRRCIVLCLKRESALSRLAKASRFIDLPDLDPPWVKNGFLATNSLLALSVLLVRAYSSAFSSNEQLPRDIDTLLADGKPNGDYIEKLGVVSDLLWGRETLVVLYGPSVATAALDLESKFSEAALGNIQLADFRNFAHGRHHWLAKRGEKTGVLAICSREEQDLCERTLGLIPQDVPVARLSLSNTGITASIAALVAVFHLVGSAGKQHGIDPGRPGVPKFGRRMYHLRALRAFNKSPGEDEISVARKLACDVQELQRQNNLSFWQDAYQRFISRLVKTTYGAVVLDYDGTLCDEQHRFSGLGADVAQELTRLLNGGILLGIATGRGDSARTDLRKMLPRQLWNNVLLGYYNGSDLGRLSDDSHPDPSGVPCDSLTSLADALCTDPIISRLADCRVSHSQVSVRPIPRTGSELVWRVVQQLAQSHGLAALRSSHSMDVLGPRVSKRILLDHLRSLLCEGHAVLSIGDKGQWPGNDFDLLGTPYSLSVDEVSADPDTCWNVAPPGHRGVEATLDYLRWLWLQPSGGLRLSVGTRRAK